MGYLIFITSNKTNNLLFIYLFVSNEMNYSLKDGGALGTCW